MTLTEKSKTGEKVEGTTHVYTYEMPCANLEIGRTYYWKIWSNVACRRFPHGSTMYAKCPYCGGRRAVASDVASFVTEDLPPRWIKLKGDIANVRDLGGWMTLDGRRLKQGMAFRGQGLNHGSANGEKPGMSRMMVEDVKYLKGVTGSLAYVLLGVLGLSRHDVEVEWESTFYPGISELGCAKDQWRSLEHFDEGFFGYGDADTPLKRRIELYLFDCGITQEEIDRFRSIMLDSDPVK